LHPFSPPYTLKKTEFSPSNYNTIQIRGPVRKAEVACLPPTDIGVKNKRRVVFPSFVFCEMAEEVATVAGQRNAKATRFALKGIGANNK